MTESIINDICELSFEYKNKLNDSAEGLRFYVKHDQVIQLAQEIILLRCIEAPVYKRLKDFVTAKNIEAIKEELRDIMLLGVSLVFEDKKEIERINDELFKRDPNQVVAEHTLECGLQFVRYGSGRIAIKTSDAWLGDMVSGEWENLVQSLNNPIS